MTPTPTLCPLPLRATVRAMLAELNDMRLEVALVPAPDPRHCHHQVRAVFGRNPGWYRELCAAYPRFRRIRKERFVDPRFKRADVAETLSRLLSTGSRSYLAGPLLAVAARQRPAPACDPAAWPYDIPDTLNDMGVAI